MKHSFTNKENEVSQIDYEEPSGIFFSENIEESPLKRERRIIDDENMKIPEFPYNENNIKAVYKTF